MGKNFPTLEKGFKDIGVSLGIATEKVGNFVNSSKGMSNIESIFGTSSYVIEGFGEALA